MFKPLAYDLSEAVKLFRQKRILQLRGLSNRLIKEASIEDNFAKAELGVITYALHKIESKEHFVNNPKWIKIKNVIATDLESVIVAAENNDLKKVIFKLKKVIVDINKIDLSIGHFVQGIFEKAKVKQASLAYSYGLSISQSAELTGADKKELQSYIGFTKMSDEEEESKSLLTRVSELKELINNG